MARLWRCGVRAAMRARGLDSDAVAGAKSRPRRRVRVRFNRFNLQEVAMKTVIISASTAMPSRFSRACSH